MAHLKNKPSTMLPQDVAAAFDGVSKIALLDALYCACLLGTDETEAQVVAKMARETIHALNARHDRPSKDTRLTLERFAAVRIDADADDETLVTVVR